MLKQRKINTPAIPIMETVFKKRTIDGLVTVAEIKRPKKRVFNNIENEGEWVWIQYGHIDIRISSGRDCICVETLDRRDDRDLDSAFVKIK